MTIESPSQKIPVYIDERAAQRNAEERNAILESAVEKALFAAPFNLDENPPSRFRPEEMRGVRMKAFEQKHIEQVRALLAEVFSMNAEHAVNDVTSIAERNPLSHIEGNHKYWVLEDAEGNVLGLTGMNDIRGDAAEHAWLGWFAVEKTLKGSSVGIVLLEYTLANARHLGKKKLYILSDNHPAMVQNFKFYHREGCAVVAVFDGDGIHKDAQCDVGDRVLSDLYTECAPYISQGVTWYIRKKDL